VQHAAQPAGSCRSRITHPALEMYLCTATGTNWSCALCPQLDPAVFNMLQADKPSSGRPAQHNNHNCC
jgi:hypothetical protein